MELTVPRRKAELLRGRGERLAIMICGETETFRALARSQLLPTDSVLEIGCSYGEATALLGRRAARVIAVDVSADALERAAARCEQMCANGGVRFESIDAVREEARLISAAVAANVNVVFVE